MDEAGFPFIYKFFLFSKNSCRNIILTNFVIIIYISIKQLLLNRVKKFDIFVVYKRPQFRFD